MRAHAIIGLALGLAIAASGCRDSDTDRIDERVDEAALAEGVEVYEEGSAALAAAIREALDAGAFGAPHVVSQTPDVTGEVTLAGAPPAGVTAALVLERAEEGPIEIALEGGETDGVTLTAGLASFASAAHVELGGGRGGHGHGEEEAEEDEHAEGDGDEIPIVVEVPLPAPAGSPASVRFLGRTRTFALEEDFPAIPAPGAP